MFTIAAFYKFAPVASPHDFRGKLLEAATSLGIHGVLLVAPEGINGTIAGSAEAVDSLLGWLQDQEGFADTVAKFSKAEQAPFRRLSVRLKQEIVALGMPQINPNTRVGTYVSPDAWDEVILDPDVLVIDCRNDYEYDVGTFKGAVDPGTRAFTEFPEYARALDPTKTPRVALFCTGGIRCEKSTGLMLDLGFKDVYHLEGGILRYLEERGGGPHLWEGDCFVFDRRVAVNDKLEPAEWEVCWACRMPVSTSDKASPHYEEGVTCPRCHDTWTDTEKAGKRTRQQQLTHSHAAF